MADKNTPRDEGTSDNGEAPANGTAVKTPMDPKDVPLYIRLEDDFRDAFADYVAAQRSDVAGLRKQWGENKKAEGSKAFGAAAQALGRQLLANAIGYTGPLTAERVAQPPVVKNIGKALKRDAKPEDRVSALRALRESLKASGMTDEEIAAVFAG